MNTIWVIWCLGYNLKEWILKSLLMIWNSCFALQIFKGFYASFFGTWFVCCVFIICFGLGFMLVASESYFKSPKVSPLVCRYKAKCVHLALVFCFAVLFLHGIVCGKCHGGFICFVAFVVLNSCLCKHQKNCNLG